MGRDGNHRTSIELSPPAAVDGAIQRVLGAGGRVWFVGGAVRDTLQRRAVRDWDLVTDLLPERLLPLFPGAASRDARLGGVHLEPGGGAVAVHSLREEEGYTDHRHPDIVRFVTEPERDAVRRDFTINAIYAEPSGRLLDPLGGCADLAAGLLRTVGDPVRRLAEDPLRLLRAVRFAARCGLAIEPGTAAALRLHAGLLPALSAERVFAELTDAFTGNGRGRALRLLVEYGLASIVVPEVVAMEGVPQPPEFHPEGCVLTHVALVLDHVRPDDPLQAWAAVLHDIGKPATFERPADRIRFSGHDTLSAEMAEVALRRLRAPRELIDAVVELCRDHIRFAVLPQMAPGKRERWLRSPRFEAHLEFHRADCLGSHGKLDIYRFAREQWLALPPEPPPPLCTGRDVLALGIAPGPVVGAILRQLQGRLDREPVSDRDTALAILAEIVAERIKGGV